MRRYVNNPLVPLALLALLFVGSQVLAGGVSGGSVILKEIDGSPQGPVSTLQVTNGTLTDNGGGDYTLTIAAGATPGGSDTYIQFNDAGALGGDADFAWDKTNNRLVTPSGSRWCPGGLSGNNGAIAKNGSGVIVYEGCTSGNGGSIDASSFNATSYFKSNNNQVSLDGSGVHVGHSSAVFLTDGDYNGNTIARARSLRNTTSNATPTELFLNGSSTRMALANDTSWTFSCLVIARRTDADNEGAGYKLEGVIDRQTNAASTALIGAVTQTVLAEDNAGWDVAATADTTNGALILTATGETSKTVKWVARCETIEATG